MALSVKPGGKILNGLRGLFSRRESGDGRKPYAATFSAPMLAAAGVLLVCAVGWAFFMGLMVGRGQNPAAKINDLTGGLLESQARESEAETPEPAAILAENQESRPPTGVERERPEGKALEAWPAAPKAEARKPKPKREIESAKPERRENAKAANQASYDFVYQVAAVKSAKDAASLDKKLKGLGLRSEAKKSGKVYLLLVSLRGKDADALAMRDKLRSMKLGKPLLLSKKERPTRQAGKK